jgi:hypothetical protein
MVGATLVGLAVPFLLGQIRGGSRVSAGPLARALAGVAALLLYLGVAALLLR